MSTPFPEPRWYHVGPHGFYDLVRLARSGRTNVVRILYILAIFAALAAAYYNDAPPDNRRNMSTVSGLKRITPRDEIIESVNHRARIAERFCITILIAQNLAVFLLMPIYIAAGIQEERDTRTLTLLFTTQLTAWQIVLGKLLSRSALVGSVLLAGLPILSFAQLWGGIDMQMIAANFWNTAMMLLSVGALSLSISIVEKGFFKSIAMTYLILWSTAMASFCCCVPLERVRDMNILLVTPFGGDDSGYAKMLIWVIVLSLIHLFVARFLLVRSSRNLDRQRGADPPPPDTEILSGIPKRRNRYWRFPPIPENVVAWKERYLDASLWMVTPIAFFPFVLFWLWMYMTVLVSHGPRSEGLAGVKKDFEPFFLLVMLGTAGTYILLVAFRLAGCLVRERQQQTLEPLLVLPNSLREFLHAKVQGNLLRFWTWLLPFGVVWLMMLFFGFPSYVNGLLLLIAVAIHLAFFASLGLFLSVVCRTTVSAYLSLGLIVFVLVIGTALLPAALRATIFTSFVSHGLNPVGYWLTLCLGDAPSFSAGVLVELSSSLLLYLSGAIALWLWTCRQFVRNPTGD